MGTFFYRFSINLFFILLTFNYHVFYCLLYSRSSLPFVSSLLPLVFVPSHICVDLPSSRLPPFRSIFLSFQFYLSMFQSSGFSLFLHLFISYLFLPCRETSMAVSECRLRPSRS